MRLFNYLRFLSMHCSNVVLQWQLKTCMQFYISTSRCHSVTTMDKTQSRTVNKWSLIFAFSAAVTFYVKNRFCRSSYLYVYSKKSIKHLSVYILSSWQLSTSLMAPSPVNSWILSHKLPPFLIVISPQNPTFHLPPQYPHHIMMHQIWLYHLSQHTPIPSPVLPIAQPAPRFPMVRYSGLLIFYLLTITHLSFSLPPHYPHPFSHIQR